MVAGFLKICPGCPTVAHSLVEFLRYYAQDFDCTRMFVDRGEFIVVVPSEFPAMTNLLVLDPFRGMNAAKSLTRFSEIQDIFEETFDRAIELMKRYADNPNIKITLDCIFGKA